MKKNLLIFILLFVLSIPAFKSLLPPGGFTSHDLTHHIVRQIDMDKLLSEGQFPPRWSGDLNNGYGYPVSIFMYPTPSILGELFHKLGYNFVDSVKAVLFISILISVVGMYLFLDSLFPGKKLAAFLGAIFYLYAPIRFIYIYVSAAVGSALAMAIIPFIFWTVVETYKGKKWTIPIGSLIIALLITSHNVTALMFAPVLLIFGGLLIYKSKERKGFFKDLALMAVLGIGLAAFFWIPAMVEKKYIIYDQVMATNWVDQFPTLWQLIRSPWGYGLSHPQAPEPGDMSHQLGLIHIAVMGILLVSIFIFRKKKDFLRWGIFSLTVFAVSIFLMLKISTPLWSNLPLLYLIQFPYRFASVSIFIAAIAACLLIAYLPFKKFLFIFLLILVLYANRNHLNVNQKFDPGDTYYMNLTETTASYNEHLPIWAYVPKNRSPGKLIILEGKGEINILENKSAKVVANVVLEVDSTLRFNQFYFPGWELSDNGQGIEYSYKESGQNKGLPVFKLPAGKHVFEARFRETTARKLADTISILSIFTIVSTTVFLIWKKSSYK